MRTNFLIDTQLWNDDVVHWPLPAGQYEFAQFNFDYANALAAIQRGDNAGAGEAVARVASDRQRCEAWLDQRKMQAPQDRKRLVVLTGQLQALLLLQSGKGDDAVRELQRLASDEQEMPLEFGPPFIDKPTNELLGEALVQLNRPSEAQAAFQDALARAPGRSLSTAELAQADKQIANTTAQKAANRHHAPVEVHNH